MSTNMAKGVVLDARGTSVPNPATNQSDFRYVGTCPPGAHAPFSVKDHFVDTGSTWVRMWIDMTQFFPNPKDSTGVAGVDAYRIGQLTEQIKEAKRTATGVTAQKVMLTLWKFPTWMNGTNVAGADLFQMKPKFTQAYKFPADVTPSSEWGAVVIYLLKTYSLGSAARPDTAAFIDALEICNEPNYSAWPQSDHSRGRTAGCKVGNMLTTSLAINAFFGKATLIAAPALTLTRSSDPDGLAPDRTHPVEDVRTTDCVIFAQDMLGILASANFGPRPDCVFTVHNYSDVRDGTLVVALVREAALRGLLAGYPNGNVQEPHVWITEGGMTWLDATLPGLTADQIRYGMAQHVYDTFMRMNNNSTSSVNGGYGIDVVMNYYFEGGGDPQYDSGLIEDVACGRAPRIGYVIWKAL